MRKQNNRRFRRAMMTTALTASMVISGMTPALSAGAVLAETGVGSTGAEALGDEAGKAPEKQEAAENGVKVEAPKEFAENVAAEKENASEEQIFSKEEEGSGKGAEKESGMEERTSEESREEGVSSEGEARTGSEKADAPKEEKGKTEIEGFTGAKQETGKETGENEQVQSEDREKASLEEGIPAKGEVSAVAEKIEQGTERAENKNITEKPTAAGEAVSALEGEKTEEQLSLEQEKAAEELKKAEEAAKKAENENEEHVLEAQELTAFSAGSKKDGESEGIDDFFTLLYSTKSKIDDNKKSFADGYESSRRINFGGKVSTEKNAVKFKTSEQATVKIWWVEGGDDNRQMGILNASGKLVAATKETLAKNALCISTLELPEGGTYYLGGVENNNYIFKVEVITGEVVREILPWDEVTEPSITAISVDPEEDTRVKVDVDAVIGDEGGESLLVEMLDAEGKLLDTQESGKEGDAHTLYFTPARSGSYQFRALLSRKEEADKESELSDAVSFMLPLAAPELKNVVNQGMGSVLVKFYSVTEAERYELILKEQEEGSDVLRTEYVPKSVVEDTEDEAEEYQKLLENLKPGKTYLLQMQAFRDGEAGPLSEEQEIEVTEKAEQEWTYAAFGSNASTDVEKCGYSKNEDDSISVWSVGAAGKIVPNSTDGLAFYYATIPSNQNFTLEATAEVDFWTFTNGQEGFGLMAADRVGKNGNGGAFWNNSYMASATKVSYNYDAESGEATDDTAKPLITMKLGLGSQEKIGVTKDNLAGMDAKDAEAVKQFRSRMTTLESSCGEKGAGTYNLFGNSLEGVKTVSGAENAKAQEVAGTIEEPLTKVRLRIQKNNTGYFVSFLSEDGEVLKVNKYYDTEALSKLDSDFVYAGFFASRSVKATFSDIELTVIDPSEDLPAEERPVELVSPNYQVLSPSFANQEVYKLQFLANADGVLDVRNGKGELLLENAEVQSGKMKEMLLRLRQGKNSFRLEFTPDEDYHPGGEEFRRLSSYDTEELVHTVEYRLPFVGKESIYVSQEGTANGSGTEESPVDIYTAVQFAQPGQTIYLHPGEYQLSRPVLIDRGIDGTEEKPIRMLTEDGERAVFDFGGKSAGFIFAGNYWHVRGIDVTNSQEGMKGVQVSGSHSTFEDIRTYRNHYTGFQVSRYLGTDPRELWPSYNLIKNCTSYANADRGFEDADGFAAKLTVGEGVVFDGCIAYNNADDGWDLFAKVETGHIGAVTIQNSMAFNNGYGLDGQDQGNGNGFKMGGESISGHHRIRNSIAWGNKAKGIDSNSCPDIEIYNCTSIDNGGANVALYTNDAKNTAYVVDGLISYRSGKEGGAADNIKTKGTQLDSAIYGEKNFFYDGTRTVNTVESGAAPVIITDEDFRSLQLPAADFENPLAVAEQFRTEDGRIDAGDFAQLSEVGAQKLQKANLDVASVSARQDGQYDALEDAEQIEGAAEDSIRLAEQKQAEAAAAPQDEPETPETGEIGIVETEGEEPEDTKASEKPNNGKHNGKGNGNSGKGNSSSFNTGKKSGKSHGSSRSGGSDRFVGKSAYKFASQNGKKQQTEKGIVDTKLGIISGAGAQYSQWVKEERGWRLYFPNQTIAKGSMVKDAGGKEQEQVAWELVDGHWYAFGADGYLKSGWVQDRNTGLWYYLTIAADVRHPAGSMYRNEKTPDGYTVDGTGAWNGK